MGSLGRGGLSGIKGEGLGCCRCFNRGGLVARGAQMRMKRGGRQCTERNTSSRLIIQALGGGSGGVVGGEGTASMVSVHYRTHDAPPRQNNTSPLYISAGFGDKS